MMVMGLNIKEIIKKLVGIKPTEIVPERIPQTHDLSAKTWGLDYVVMAVIDRGLKLRLSVWCPVRIWAGDYLLLRGEGEDGKTRYRVDEIEYPGDPADMSFIDASFAPRQESAW